MARQGEQAAELMDVILEGIQALANDPRAGRQRYRALLLDAAEDYMESNRHADTERVRNTKSSELKDAGLTGQQLVSKKALIDETYRQAIEQRSEGRSSRRIWRRFLKASKSAVDTFLEASKIGHALKELLDLADVTLDS